MFCTTIQLGRHINMQRWTNFIKTMLVLWQSWAQYSGQTCLRVMRLPFNLCSWVCLFFCVCICIWIVFVSQRSEAQYSGQTCLRVMRLPFKGNPDIPQVFQSHRQHMHINAVSQTTLLWSVVILSLQSPSLSGYSRKYASSLKVLTLSIFQKLAHAVCIKWSIILAMKGDFILPCQLIMILGAKTK